MKSLIKTILFWNFLSIKSKSRIKKLLGMGTKKVAQGTKKVAQGTKKVGSPKINIFTSYFHKIPVANTDLKHFEIGLYFAGGVGNLYQVEQWLGTLTELNKEKRIILIVRSSAAFEWIKTNTEFTTVFCTTIADLTKLYEENNFKCILYVNHGFKNFQSLILGDALHVHINHGESDKTSTITNQSKAYDYIFIVSDAGYDKYKDNLISVDMEKFVKVGRPQLDYIKEVPTFNTDKKVILYAPTWEGTHESMDFSSLNDYGMILVQQIINHPDYYLVYKPHPNTGSRDTLTKGVNDSIIKMINQHSEGEVVLEGDINSLYPHIDLAIFDNSAVAIDYLEVNKPMIMTDMFYRIVNRQTKPTIVKAARMLSKLEAYTVTMIILEELEKDTLRDERAKIKKYFLGEYNCSQKESTQKFVREVLNVCEQRDILVDTLATSNLEKNFKSNLD